MLYKIAVVDFCLRNRCKFGTSKLTVLRHIGWFHPLNWIPGGYWEQGKHLGNFYFRAKKGQKIPKLKAVIHSF